MPSDKDWTPLIPATDCRSGCARFVRVGDHELAVFRLENPDRFIVTRNSCPHAGGNLSAGEIRDGNVVVCPWHEWEFDLDRGHCTTSERVKLETFPSREDNGMVCAQLPS